MDFSIVIPLYKCSLSITELNKRLFETLGKLSPDFEIIYVNDASPENDWEIVTQLSKTDPRIKGINFSRNFGQHYAITAGLDVALGNWIVVMDGDLQDQPEEISKLWNKAKEGFEVVFARRENRKDAFVKKTFSKLFYKLFSYLTDTKQDYSVANFGIFHSSVIHSINKMNDYIRVFPVLIQWVGFNKTSINVVHSHRKKGKSSYGIFSLINLALNMIISFSEKPLKITMLIGLCTSFVSFLIGLYYFIMYLRGEILVPGYTSLIISIAFSTGMIISFLGLVGLYIGKINIQIKNRPKYIIKESF